MYTVKFLYSPIMSFNGHRGWPASCVYEGSKEFELLSKARNFWNECTIPISGYPEEFPLDIVPITNDLESVEETNDLESVINSHYNWEEDIIGDNHTKNISIIEKKQEYLRKQLKQLQNN